VADNRSTRSLRRPGAASASKGCSAKSGWPERRRRADRFVLRRAAPAPWPWRARCCACRGDHRRRAHGGARSARAHPLPQPAARAWPRAGWLRSRRTSVADVRGACERVIVLTRAASCSTGCPRSGPRGGGQGLDGAPRARGRGGLPAGALVVDQVPEARVSCASRVLHGLQPHAAAEPTPPTLEYGYLWLVREPAR